MFLETRSLPRAVKALLVVNVGLYIFLRIIPGLYDWAVQWCALIPSQVIQNVQYWRLFTYLFLHANIFWHLIFNMLAIWMFGPEIERRLGTSTFLFYYFLTGIGGGLCSVIIYPSSLYTTIGSNGSIFGLLVAFAFLFPDAVITMIFPPISMKAKHFALAFGVIQLLMVFERSGGIDWAVPVGGMVIGYLYLKFSLFSRRHFNLKDIKDRLLQKRKRRREQFIKEKIDPILDKISKMGIKGLSRKERNILKRARYKI